MSERSLETEEDNKNIKSTSLVLSIKMFAVRIALLCANIVCQAHIVPSLSN